VKGIHSGQKQAIMRGIRNLTSKPVVREGAPLLGLYWLYSSIRFFVARDDPYEAFNNAFKLIDLERQLGVFYEPTIQRWLVDHALGVVRVANEFYTIGYFPVLILCGILLYRFCPQRFRTFKLTFMLGLGFALVSFSVFPLAPPRLLPEVGFVDTQWVYGSSLYRQKSVLSFYNPYAAMPSLHFGWALLVGLMAHSFDRWVLKVLGVLYPCCMAIAIVITGHHYFLDIVGGGGVIALAYSIVKTLPRAFPVPTPDAAGAKTGGTWLGSVRGSGFGRSWRSPSPPGPIYLLRARIKSLFGDISVRSGRHSRVIRAAYHGRRYVRRDWSSITRDILSLDMRPPL
jgi:membrane-associated phospholipid phosphatase